MTFMRVALGVVFAGGLWVGTAQLGAPAHAFGGRLGSEHSYGHGGISAAAVRSDSTNLYYDIESLNSYCDGGGSSCHVGGSQEVTAGYHYGEVDVIGARPNQRFGSPASVYVDCDQADERDGTLYYQFAYALANDSSGRSFGFAGILSADASEANTAAQSLAAVGADGPTSMNYDGNPPNGHDVGTAVGIQATDNSVDLPASGGFRIRVAGTIYNQHYDTTSQQWITDPTSTGTLTCSTGGPDANAIGDAYAEGEMEADPANSP